MWFDIWNTPLFWWFVAAVLSAGLIILVFWRRQRNKADPLKEHLDYFCRCYARGEISRDDFEELKKDLREYEKQIKSAKEIKSKIPNGRIRKNNKVNGMES